MEYECQAVNQPSRSCRSDIDKSLSRSGSVGLSANCCTPSMVIIGLLEHGTVVYSSLRVEPRVSRNYSTVGRPARPQLTAMNGRVRPFRLVGSISGDAVVVGVPDTAVGDTTGAAYVFH